MNVFVLMVRTDDADAYLLGVFGGTDAAKARASQHSDTDNDFSPLTWAKAECGGIFAYDGFCTYLIDEYEVENNG